MKIKIKKRVPRYTEDTIPYDINPLSYSYKPNQSTKLLFLQRYVRYQGHIGKSCYAAQISRQTFFNWIQKDRKFKEAFAEVNDCITEELEEVGIKRALRDSDDLMKFFLKARNRKKYGDKLDHALEGAFSLRDFYAHESRGTKTDVSGSPDSDTPTA